MKRTAWMATTLAACALWVLSGGCSKPATAPPAASKPAPAKGSAAEGSGTKRPAAPTPAVSKPMPAKGGEAEGPGPKGPAADAQPTEPANSSNVMKAVGKAIFKGFTSPSAEASP